MVNSNVVIRLNVLQNFASGTLVLREFN